MASRFIQIRPDNIDSNARVSFKQGFPMISFTIQAQDGILDPSSIRINGRLSVFKDLARTPVYTDDAQAINMDNRLGIFSLWDQLVVRHNKSKQTCEHIRHYNRYLSSYLGMTSSQQDMVGHLSETALIMPNSAAMRNIVASGDAASALAVVPKEFSCHLPSGFMMSGNKINLMENSFGGIQIELHLSPDSNCLFTDGAAANNVANAFYELSDLSLTCEVQVPRPEELSSLRSQTSGALEFNSITSLFTSINTNNAQLQYSLGLKNLQSVFMNFCPATHINSLTSNGLATTGLSDVGGTDPTRFINRVQWLRGGQKYPLQYDVVDQKNTPGNTSVGGAGLLSVFQKADGQLLRQFMESIVPEYMMDRSSITPANANYPTKDLGDSYTDVDYKSTIDGGMLWGLGIRYSQFNKGQDFSQQQWGCSLESFLDTDNPQAVFLYFKAKNTLAWNENGVQLIN